MSGTLRTFLMKARSSVAALTCNAFGNSTKVVPKGQMTIARRFNAGLSAHQTASPEGTAEKLRQGVPLQPSSWDSASAGYCRDVRPRQISRSVFVLIALVWLVMATVTFGATAPPVSKDPVKVDQQTEAVIKGA